MLRLIISLLPLLVPLIRAILLGMERAQRDYEFDQEKLEALVANLTEKEIRRVVEAHSDRVVREVPSEEQAARTKRLDELEEILSQDSNFNT